jgi:hypothetical protein
MRSLAKVFGVTNNAIADATKGEASRIHVLFFSLP